MTAATIQVRFVDAPDPPKRMKGRVKDTDGEAYTVKPKDVGLFQEGRFYDIEFDEFTYKGGGQGKSITKIVPRPQERPQVVPEKEKYDLPPGMQCPIPQSSHSTPNVAGLDTIAVILAEILAELRAIRSVYRA